MVLLVVEALYVQGLIRIFPIDMVKEYTTDVVRVCVRQKWVHIFYERFLQVRKLQIEFGRNIPY